VGSEIERHENFSARRSSVAVEAAGEA
jgi:hypothetical protein